jgi:hypothetical protein
MRKGYNTKLFYVNKKELILFLLSPQHKIHKDKIQIISHTFREKLERIKKPLLIIQSSWLFFYQTSPLLTLSLLSIPNPSKIERNQSCTKPKLYPLIIKPPPQQQQLLNPPILTLLCSLHCRLRLHQVHMIRSNTKEISFM